MGLSLYGAEVERLHQVERRFRIPVAGLKDEAAMTLAQLSDIHLGNFFSLSMLDALIVQTAASAPDLLVITGDLFDDVDKNAQAAEILEQHVDDVLCPYARNCGAPDVGQSPHCRIWQQG